MKSNLKKNFLLGWGVGGGGGMGGLNFDEIKSKKKFFVGVGGGGGMGGGSAADYRTLPKRVYHKYLL